MKAKTRGAGAIKSEAEKTPSFGAETLESKAPRWMPDYGCAFTLLAHKRLLVISLKNENSSVPCLVFAGGAFLPCSGG